jgi:hypothetical protein
VANRSREQRLLDDHPGSRECVSQMDDSSYGTLHSGSFLSTKTISDNACSTWSTSGVSPLRGMRGG